MFTRYLNAVREKLQPKHATGNELGVSPATQSVLSLQPCGPKAEKPLFLILKKEFFDAIACGKKTVEYRDDTPYWRNRLTRKKFETVLFQMGYEKDAPRLSAKIVDIRLTDCYEISLSEIVLLRPSKSGERGKTQF